MVFHMVFHIWGADMLYSSATNRGIPAQSARMTCRILRDSDRFPSGTNGGILRSPMAPSE